MSLLFEHAVEVFDRDGASLVAASDAALATAEPRVPVRPVAEFAAHHDSLTDPEDGWTCLPLHGPDDAVPTDEYVAYTDHEVRGEVFVVMHDGDHEAVPADRFGRTPLALAGATGAARLTEPVRPTGPTGPTGRDFPPQPRSSVSGG